MVYYFCHCMSLHVHPKHNKHCDTGFYDTVTQEVRDSETSLEDLAE